MKTENLTQQSFTERKPDMRPFDQAWREDFPNSKPVPKRKSENWNILDGLEA